MFEVLAGTYNADVRPSETPSDSRYHLPDGPDIPYGAIRVVEYDTHWKPLANDDYITPVPAGSLAIVDIVDDKLHLRTGLGEDLIFDLKTRQYVAMKQPSGESREITDGLVESRPQNAITIDGYLAYAQWQLDDMEPPLRITAYTSERPYKGSRLVVETESLREPVTLSVREGHTMALRAVRIIENNYLLLLEGRTTAVVLDLHQKRLLSSLDAYSVMVAAGRPFSWP